jgi:OmpA-OmpF porin, OOP family
MAANLINSFKLSVMTGFFFVFISSNLKTQSELRFSIHFESNSFNLSEQAIKKIDSVLAQLTNHPKAYNVKFIGHSDSIGSYASNQFLSLKRANQVAYYFGTKNFLKGKISCSSMAYSKPLSDNSTDEKKYLNRRV